MVTQIIPGAEVDELIGLIRAGDEDAGAYLVSICGGRLAGYIAMIAADLGQADQEIVAEKTIERAVRNIQRFEASLGTFDGWLRGYARYVVMERRRAGSSIAVSPEEIPDMVGEAAEAPTAHGSQLRDAVVRAIVALGQTDQMIINLRDYEGLSYDDIAAELGVKPAACRQRHARALSRVRQLIEGDPLLDKTYLEAIK